MSFQIVTSKSAIAELKRVFSRPKFAQQLAVSTFHVTDILQTLQLQAIFVKKLSRPKISVRDPKDTVILATAIQGHADYLVTGDKDLLVLSGHKSIKPLKIVTPTEFIHLIN